MGVIFFCNNLNLHTLMKSQRKHLIVKLYKKANKCLIKVSIIKPQLDSYCIIKVRTLCICYRATHYTDRGAMWCLQVHDLLSQGA